MTLPGPSGRLLLVLAILALLPAAAGFDDYRVSVLTGAVLIGLLSMAWNLMAGIGLVSLGHAAFFGIGAYTAAITRIAGHPVMAALGMGGIAALFFSGLFVLLAGRLRGAYFALATLVAVAMPKTAALSWEKVTGGASGLIGIPSAGINAKGLFEVSGRLGEYYSLLVIVGCLSATLWWLRHRSRFGPAASALRQDEAAARSLGIYPCRYRASAIFVSAFFTGIGGGYYALQVRYLEPHYIFSLHFSIIPLVAAVFGGLFTGWGPMLGAVILHCVNEFILRRVFLTSHDVLYGVMLAGAVLFFPQGIVGWLKGTKEKYIADR